MKSQVSKKLFSLSLVLVSLGAIAFANNPNQLSNLSITTILESNDQSGAVADIQSDNLGPYHDGVDGVSSFLTTNGYNGIVWGDWQFGTLNSTVRLQHDQNDRWPIFSVSGDCALLRFQHV